MTTWTIPTENNPLGAVRGVLQTLWITANLESILLPLNGNAESTSPFIIETPDQIRLFNPFTLLIPINAVQLVSDLPSERPRPQVGASLRKSSHAVRSDLLYSSALRCCTKNRHSSLFTEQGILQVLVKESIQQQCSPLAKCEH